MLLMQAIIHLTLTITYVDDQGMPTMQSHNIFMRK